jgi:hypothetical protein
MYTGAYIYYAHDHLYSPAALIFSGGVVLERYEYDAYGDCHVLEPNFADDEDGKSDYGNPYLFQGKRLDLLDNGGLKLMSWPYRDYSTYLGRWLQVEKLGMIPNDNIQNNAFHPRRQYEDTAAYYEFAASNPISVLDLYGLKVCCKIREDTTHTICEDYFYGPCVTWTTTTCTQEEIPNADGCPPEAACCAHYKDRHNVTVYGWYEHKEGCCWCKAHLVWQPSIFRGASHLGWAHAQVRVECEQGRDSWSADVWPKSKRWATIPHLVPVKFYAPAPGERAIYKGRTSCDSADKTKRMLGGLKWRYWFNPLSVIPGVPSHDCRSFARKYSTAIGTMCP